MISTPANQPVGERPARNEEECAPQARVRRASGQCATEARQGRSATEGGRDGWGFITTPGGVRLACPEKALLDTLYLAPTRSRPFATLPEVRIPKRFDLEAAAVTERWPGYNPSAIH